MSSPFGNAPTTEEDSISMFASSPHFNGNLGRLATTPPLTPSPSPIDSSRAKRATLNLDPIRFDSFRTTSPSLQLVPHPFDFAARRPYFPFSRS
jgi:hypothetical protein